MNKQQTREHYESMARAARSEVRFKRALLALVAAFIVLVWTGVIP